MTETQIPPKKIKTKGPIRTEVVIPLILIMAGTWAYFFFLFDGHLRYLIEFGGYHIVGAEVNVGTLNTSFSKANIRVQKIQITNPQKPSHNMIEVGDIRFGLLWDGLLRARFVVEEMATEQIGIDLPRKNPGRVKPPPPPEPENEGPSAIEKEAEKLKGQALDKLKKDQAKNIFGDLANILSGVDANDQLKSIEDSLPSKAKMKEVETSYNEKRKKWDEKLKSLPQGKDIQSISDRMNKVKTNNFKTPQEVVESVNQFQALIKEADDKFKTIQGASQELESDLKNLDQGLKDLDAMLKKDIKDLEARFRIPQLDARTLAQGLFSQYLDPYIEKMNYYKGLAQKYIPPKYLKKGQEKDPEPEFQPHPRAKGVTYEFGRQNSYPLFWIKKVLVSSKANEELGIGDMKGQITHITSNQAIINKPTELQVTGSLPKKQVNGIGLKMSVDTRGEASRIEYNFGVDSYPMGEKKILDSPDVQIGLKEASASILSSGELVGLKDYEIKFGQTLKQAQFLASSKNEIVDDVLKNVFAGLPAVTIEAKAKGTFPNMSFDVYSNMGDELVRGFEKQVARKIEEAKAKLNAFIQDMVGKEKQKLEAEVQKLRNQFDSEVKKVEAQLDQKKKEGEGKVKAAQQDAEKQADQAKKAAENEAKKKLETEGKKAIDDLKKKFGL